MSLLTFIYEKETRVVEPHAYGRNREGQNVLLAYQTNGPKTGWHKFLESAMHEIRTVPDTFSPIRGGYVHDDPEIQETYLQL